MEQFNTPNETNELFYDPPQDQPGYNVNQTQTNRQPIQNIPSSYKPAMPQRSVVPHRMQSTYGHPDERVKVDLHDNPDPIMISIIILLIFMTAMLVYRTFMAYNMSGVWIDNANHEHVILHNTLTCNMILDSNLQARLKSGIIITSSRPPLYGYVHQDVILWSTREKWVRARPLA